MGIVHLLEPVQVDEQHGHAGAVAAGAGQRGVEMLLELRAVGQPGEVVVVGQVRQTGVRLGQLPLDAGGGR